MNQHSLCRHGQVLVVKLGAEYASSDASGLRNLAAFLDNLMTLIERPRLLLDLTHTRCIGAGFLSVIARCRIQSQLQAGQFALCNLGLFSKQVLQAVRLDSVWPIYDSLSAGLDAVNGTQVTEIFKEKKAC